MKTNKLENFIFGCIIGLGFFIISSLLIAFCTRDVSLLINWFRFRTGIFMTIACGLIALCE